MAVSGSVPQHRGQIRAQLALVRPDVRWPAGRPRVAVDVRLHPRLHPGVDRRRARADVIVPPVGVDEGRSPRTLTVPVEIASVPAQSSALAHVLLPHSILSSVAVLLP